MDKQTVTIYDVAREASVSMATVSRVVNGNANVKQETKEKVEAVIKRLGYRPNAVARGLASRKTTTIGVVIPDVTDNYFAELARGINDVAQMYHYHIILANADEAGTKEAQVIDNLLSKQVDGVIFMGNSIGTAVREEMVRADVPFVLAGTVDKTGEQPSVNIDYISAVDEATASLIKAGHKQIAFISGPLEDEINRDYKLMGYKNAITVAGYDYDPALVLSTNYDYQSGYALADQVRNTAATAAIIVSDEMAAGVLNGLTDAGLRVPEDFEIITNNNSKLAMITRPQLSSITQPMYDLGAVAMRMLTKMMEREELAVKNVILPHGYIARESTKNK
ncbi:catabolite control protein A [Weissella oryzae SG25]|uniref:Catabolite control protein A n=1 Tax=Weissella oryzae (strain DSM 25784 / JCM 18191 / LMG 30913 / SG25) TaxID=1329250 RepID=A0A069CS80_WEIOS|nr:catabolite control protein A [Weissella oryzae]GAK30252.1 catabolite control protein A [Weissella oryzae SG25]